MTKPVKHSKKFVQLQSKWYQKLKDEGFDDIEWYNEESGYGQNSVYMKRSTGHMKATFDPAAAQLYSLYSNFLEHRGTPAPNFTVQKRYKPKKFKHLHLYVASTGKSVHKTLPKDYTLQQKLHHIDSLIIQLLLEGFSYREMTPALQASYPKARLGFSIFWLCRRIALLRKACMLFNYKDPEGLYSPEQLSQQEEEQNQLTDFIESNQELYL